MADSLIWIALVGIVIVALAAAFLVIYKGKEKKHETDYRAFFILGIVWLPLGITMDFPIFFILGLVYMGIGLANRDKWKKDAGFTKSTRKKPYKKNPSSQSKKLNTKGDV